MATRFYLTYEELKQVKQKNVYAHRYSCFYLTYEELKLERFEAKRQRLSKVFILPMRN